MTQHEAEVLSQPIPTYTIFYRGHVKYYMKDDLYSLFSRSIIFNIFLQCPLKGTIICESQLLCP